MSSYAHLKKSQLVVLVGTGGSALGVQAVFHALRSHATAELLVLDTIDSFSMQMKLALIEGMLAAGRKVSCIIVSHSGNTLETRANAAILKQCFDRFSSFEKHALIITRENSPLVHAAKKERIACLEIPQKTIGRFSLFTPASLVPLELLGIPIKNFMRGKHAAIKDLKKIMSRAHSVHTFLTSGHSVWELLVSDPSLAPLGLWWRQLVAESVCKEQRGIIPIVSVASRDFHTFLACSLDGPQKIMTTILTVAPQAPALTIPKNIFSHHFSGKTNIQLHEILLKSAQARYKSVHHPTITITLKNVSPFAVGYVMESMMIEVQALAYMLDVDPLTQPAIDKFKKIVHEKL